MLVCGTTSMGEQHKGNATFPSAVKWWPMGSFTWLGQFLS